MSTILIRNVSSNRRVAVSSRGGNPPHFALGPSQSVQILQAELSAWPAETKQDISLYVQHGFLRLDELNTVHAVPVKDPLTPTAYDLASAIADANTFKQAYNDHLNSLVSHSIVDTVNVISAADATNLSSMITLLTEVKTDFAGHLDEVTGVGHVTADATNTITSADAIDLSSSLTLATEIRTDYNAHDADASPTWHAVAGGSHQITASVPIDLPSLLTFIGDAETQYAAHISDAAMHDPVGNLYSLDPALASPSTQPGANAWLNDFKIKYNAHIAATVPVTGAHAVDDSSNTINAAVPTNLATSLTFLEEAYAKYNKHLVQAYDDAAGPLTPLQILAY